MTEPIPLHVTPKSESYRYEGHRYVLKFEPQSRPEHRWSWVVYYTTVFNFFGNAPSIELAGRRARAQITKMNRRMS